MSTPQLLPPEQAAGDLWAYTSGISGPARQRFVLLHGFTQTARSWYSLATRLSSAGEVVVFDMPGHGRSSEISADLRETAALVVAAGPAIYIGYSMGARVALHIAIHYPEAVQALVLIGGTPGIVDADERRKRREADESLADDIARLGVGSFLDTWLSGPLFRNLRPDSDDIAGRLTNTVAGLSMSLRRAGTGTQEPLWSMLETIQTPSLVVAGSDDAKFCEIGSQTATAIGPNAKFLVVAGAGHAAHLEQPEAFEALLERELRI